MAPLRNGTGTSSVPGPGWTPALPWLDSRRSRTRRAGTAPAAAPRSPVLRPSQGTGGAGSDVPRASARRVPGTGRLQLSLRGRLPRSAAALSGAAAARAPQFRDRPPPAAQQTTHRRFQTAALPAATTATFLLGAALPTTAQAIGPFMARTNGAGGERHDGSCRPGMGGLDLASCACALLARESAPPSLSPRGPVAWL